VRIHEKIKVVTPVALVIFLGTSGCKQALLIRFLECIFGVARACRIKFLAADACGVESRIDVPAVYRDVENITLGPDEFLGIKMPDNEYLARAEREGRLWMMRYGWHLQPNVLFDNSGTGGNQRNGAVLWSLNEEAIRPKINRALRELRDYQVQQQRIDIAAGTKSEVNTIPIIVCGTDLGGMASSRTDDICRMAGQEAYALKCDVRIIRLSLVMGCLNPTDREMAARNQLLSHKRLQAHLDGNYMTIAGENKTRRPVCDSVIMLSDANNDGGINSLEGLYSTAANYIFYLLSTPMGQIIRERAVDIEEGRPKDELGGTLMVSTASISKIHLDIPRIVEYCKFCLMTMLYGWFLRLCSDDQPRKDATSVAEGCRIMETATHHCALDRILSFRGIGGGDIRQHLMAMFAGLAEGVKRGIAGCIELAQASKQILETELPKRIVSQISGESSEAARGFARQVSTYVNTYLDMSDGIARAKMFLERLTDTIGDCDQSNSCKLERAAVKIKSITSMIARAHETLAQLRKRHRIIQAISIFKKAWIHRTLRVYTDMAIKTSLEFEGRTILKNELYPSLRDVVAGELIRIETIADCIESARNDMTAQSNRLIGMSPVLTTPIGLPLAGPTFLDKQLGYVTDHEGGKDELLGRLYLQFRQTVGSLDAFESADSQKQSALLDYCARIVALDIKHLNVIDVFRQEYSTTLKQRIEMAIKESRGRLCIAGEGHEMVPTIKLIGVHDRSSGEWIAKMANEVDSHSGDWRLVETGDPNSIVFMQQRSRVSLTRLIQQSRHFWKEPSDPQQRVQLGSDPIISLAPGVDCGNREVDTVIAMGLSTGYIKAAASGFMLNHQDDPIAMGSSLPQVRKYLKNDYPALMSVYCGFVMELNADSQATLKNLDNTASSTDCKLVGELGNSPFANAKAIADALLPHVRRIKVQ
jgi:hypothetical protein